MSDPQKASISINGGGGWRENLNNNNHSSALGGEVARHKKLRNLSSGGNLEWLKEPKPHPAAHVSVAEQFRKARDKVKIFPVDRKMLEGDFIF